MPKRKDGRYEVTIQINKKRKHFLGNTLKEAKEKRDRYIELMEKCPLATDKILLKEWMSAWLETVKTNISPVTYKNYYYTVKKICAEYANRKYFTSGSYACDVSFIFCGFTERKISTNRQ